MFPDKLDVFIMSEIFDAYQNKEDSNNWDISEKYCCQCLGVREDDKSRFRLNTHKVYKKIVSRLNKYCKIGIFFKSKNGDNKNIYNMDLNKIIFIKHKCSDGMKSGIWIRI